MLLQSWHAGILAAEAVGFCLFFSFFDCVKPAELNWTYVSFAVVYPVVFFAKETWKRRETALSLLATVKVSPPTIDPQSAFFSHCLRRPDPHKLMSASCCCLRGSVCPSRCIWPTATGSGRISLIQLTSRTPRCS